MPVKFTGRIKTRGWFRVHSFVGVITGLMLFVICWSGTFAVVAHELDWLATPEARMSSDGGTRASWGAWLEAVKREYPQAKVRRLEAPRFRESAAVAVIDLPHQELVRVYLQPHTAEVLGHWSYFTLQRFFRNLHSYLFLPEIGSYLVAFFSLTLLVSMISALFFYKRWWTRFLRFKTGPGRVFWSEWHKTSGLWSLWFMGVLALTGLWYLFEMTRSDWLDGTFSFAGTGDYAVHFIPKPQSDPEQPELPLDSLIERVREVRPELEIRMVNLVNSHEGALYVQGQTDHVLLGDRANQVHLDRRSGAILYNQNASDYPLYWRWSDTADPLHFGDFGRLWSKAVWFLFGLLLCGLILTGTYLHAQRLARQADGGAGYHWPGTGAALVVSLVVLAASVLSGFREAEYFGPSLNGDKQLPVLTPGVKAVMAGWVGLTLAIIAAWVWMLWRAPRLRPRATT